MAISPPGDIVLDVTRAADPQSVAAARARLVDMANAAADAQPFRTAGTDPVPQPRLDKADTGDSTPKSYVKFEGMVLQTFLQSMMPKDTESVYGGGISGDMWKSLMAQTLGESMAERGGIGIASHLMRDHYSENGHQMPLRGVDRSAGKAGTDTQALLSSALVHELQRRAVDTLDQRQHTNAVTSGGPEGTTSRASNV